MSGKSKINKLAQGPISFETRHRRMQAVKKVKKLGKYKTDAHLTELFSLCAAAKTE
jgi:hypothetical protein